MTHQKLLYLRHYYVDKQVFSWRAKKVQICCIITFRSRFSHDAPKRCKFDSLIRGKAGFLKTQPKTKCTCRSRFFSWRTKSYIWCIITWKSRFSQVFSWRAKKVLICCNITWKSRFSHDAPKTLIFDAFICGEAVYSWHAELPLYLVHYYSIQTINVLSWCKRQKPVFLSHY